MIVGDCREFSIQVKDVRDETIETPVVFLPVLPHVKTCLYGKTSQKRTANRE